jgi:lactate dehydrogenase-like 2-hydroxyacid dehydrogenase
MDAVKEREQERKLRASYLVILILKAARPDLFRGPLSDFIVPMVPLSPETLHLINAQTIKQLKDGAFLINTCSGSVRTIEIN